MSVNDLMTSIKYVLFTFPDNTHFVMRTTLNTALAPEMEEGCLYDLDLHTNFPVDWFAEAKREVLDEYPEEYREESKFYGKIYSGI